MHVDENDKMTTPAYTPFTEQRKDIDRLSTLYSFKESFELLQTDIFGIRFLAKSAVDLKHCLLFVNLFTSKTYTFSMKNKSLLKNIEHFLWQYNKKKETWMRKLEYKEIKNFSEMNEKSRIQNTKYRCLKQRFEVVKHLLLNKKREFK